MNPPVWKHFLCGYYTACHSGAKAKTCKKEDAPQRVLRKGFVKTESEIDLFAVQAADQDLFEIFGRGLARVGAGAGIAESLLRDKVDGAVELFVRHAVLAEAGCNIDGLVQLLDLFHQLIRQLLIILAGQADVAGDVRIAA